MFQTATEANITAAAYVHAEARKASHRSFCSAAFVAAHTPARQAEYIRAEMQKGRTFYLLVLDSPKGIVSVCGSLIENLYVLPCEQGKGYGAMLLHHAESLCGSEATLWVLNNNRRALSLYLHAGYVLTGSLTVLSDTLAELEMRRTLTG